MHKTENTPTPTLHALTSLLAETFFQLMQKEEEVEALKARIAHLEYEQYSEIRDEDFEDLNKKP